MSDKTPSSGSNSLGCGWLLLLFVVCGNCHDIDRLKRDTADAQSKASACERQIDELSDAVRRLQDRPH